MLPSTAAAAVMTKPGAPLEIRNFPLSPVPDDGALVAVTCCTICRSDLHTWLGRREGPLPTILGHEIVGVVAELGAGLTHDALDRPLQVGDRITWTLHSCCRKCFYCVDKQLPMKCRTLRKYGHDACDLPPYLMGGFAEYCYIDGGTSVLKLPETLPDVLAAPANCATATIAAAWEAAAFQAGESVLIQGAGALGCYAAAYAAYAGARRVIVTDVNPDRLELIRCFGATDCIDASQTHESELPDRVKDITGGFGADCALELAGVPATIPPGLASLRKGGRYIEVGCSFPEAYASIDMSLVLWNRLTLQGVHNYDIRHLRAAIDLLTATQDRFPYEKILGAAYNLADISHALAAAEAGEAMRIAVTPAGGAIR